MRISISGRSRNRCQSSSEYQARHLRLSRQRDRARLIPLLPVLMRRPFPILVSTSRIHVLEMPLSKLSEKGKVIAGVGLGVAVAVTVGAGLLVGDEVLDGVDVGRIV